MVIFSWLRIICDMHIKCSWALLLLLLYPQRILKPWCCRAETLGICVYSASQGGSRVTWRILSEEEKTVPCNCLKPCFIKLAKSIAFKVTSREEGSRLLGLLHWQNSRVIFTYTYIFTRESRYHLMLVSEKRIMTCLSPSVTASLHWLLVLGLCQYLHIFLSKKQQSELQYIWGEL